MSKKQEQIDFAEIYGALTFLNPLLREVGKIREQSYFPGADLLYKKLCGVQKELNEEAFRNFSNLMTLVGKEQDDECE